MASSTELSRDDLGPDDVIVQEQIPVSLGEVRLIMTLDGGDEVWVQVDGAGIDQELTLPINEDVVVEGWTFRLLDTTSGLTAIRVIDPDGNQG